MWRTWAGSGQRRDRQFMPYIILQASRGKSRESMKVAKERPRRPAHTGPGHRMEQSLMKAAGTQEFCQREGQARQETPVTRPPT